jgi:hypothetical protein
MSCVPYAIVVGILMHTIVFTCLYIAHVLEVLRRYMLKPGKERQIIVKRVFRYLCGTNDYAICYKGKPEADREVNVHGFVDVDWAIDLDR